MVKYPKINKMTEEEYTILEEKRKQEFLSQRSKLMEQLMSEQIYVTELRLKLVEIQKDMDSTKMLIDNHWKKIAELNESNRRFIKFSEPIYLNRIVTF